MPSFRYQAVDVNGLLIKGSTHCVDDQELEARLAEKGITLVTAKVKTSARWGNRVFQDRVRQRDKIEFFYRLQQTLDLGLPLLTALEENAAQLPSRGMRQVVAEVRIAIENGNTLTDAMARFPRVFDRLDLAVVRMGEMSGVLPKCLKDLCRFLEWKEEIRATVRRAAIYPAFILVVILAVIAVWVGYVLPQLAELLVQMGVDLPPMTRFTLFLSDAFHQWWPGFVLFPFWLALSFFLLQRTEKGGLFLHRTLLRLPFVGSIFLHIAMARLSQNFATMFRAGMSINGIFDILSQHVLSNRYLNLLLKRTFAAVQQGESLSDSFKKAGGFPPLLLGAVRNGETSGTLEAAFERLGQYYDREAKRSVQAMVAVLEPLSIVMLAGIFGTIILSILLPLYDVVGSF